jgi:predicted ATPase/transcriptional regulator with XRE-family HTH domain
MSVGVSFGRLIRNRRRALDMTQRELAEKVRYSIFTIRKVEADERRPSRQLAEALALYLDVAPAERPAFVVLARACSDDAIPPPLPAIDDPRARSTREHPRAANLPSPLTRLIGREDETAKVCASLVTHAVRLLTLVGPPGIGKTRLGLQVAAEVLGFFDDRVHFIALAPLTDPALVAPTIAKTLGIKESAGTTPVQSIVDHLSGHRVLLVLDNFEHMLPAAPVVAEMLTACPGLSVLATSRAALRLRGETLYPVPPMALPDPVRDTTAAAVARHASAQLFVDRAQAVKPDFELSDANARQIAALCTGLEGLPLAIELVAARVKFLPPDTLLARLSHRLALLADGPRDLPERQQTLRGTIDWSYDLLDAGAQRLFARLAVFVGGCSLRTAEEVCDPDGDLPVPVLDGLTALADESLLRHEQRGDGEIYFYFFETIREYATERLAEHDDEHTIRGRYAEHYLTLAQNANRGLAGADQEAWLDRLDAEHNNIRAALEWYLQGNATEHGLHLVAALWKFWRIRAHAVEGRRWIERVLLLPGGLPHRARAQALYGAGWIALDLCDYAAAKEFFDRSVALYRRLDDSRGVAEALHGVGMVVQREGDDEQAEILFTESLMRYRELQDDEGIAWSIDHLGCAALNLGDYVGATRRFDESAEIFERLRHAWGTAISVHHQALAALARGDHTRALQRNHDGLARFRELDNAWGIAASYIQLGYAALAARRPDQAGEHFRTGLSLHHAEEDRGGIARSLMGLASTAVAHGDSQRAAHFFGAVEPLAGVLPAGTNPIADQFYQRDVLAVRSAANSESVSRVWAQGRAMPLGQVIALALTNVSA